MNGYGKNGGTKPQQEPSWMSADRSSQVDEIMRHRLRITNPRDPKEVAAALERAYPEASQKLRRQSRGLPVELGPSAEAAPVRVATCTLGEREAERVMTKLEMDLNALVAAVGNRDRWPEMSGQGYTLRADFAEAVAEARGAQDPAKLDRAALVMSKFIDHAFAAREQGSEMGREVQPLYRRLANTLDEAVRVTRVIAGEALYSGGLSEGGLLLHVPWSDIQERREALINALRRFTGLDAGGYGLEQKWDEDMAAYRTLMKRLEEVGSRDLRVYLREQELTARIDRMLASLYSGVQGEDSDALRRFQGATEVEIAQMKELYSICYSLSSEPLDGSEGEGASESRTSPKLMRVSPAFNNFRESLGLFTQIFNNARSGARLMLLALPQETVLPDWPEGDLEIGETLIKLVERRIAWGRAVDSISAEMEPGFEEFEVDGLLLLDEITRDLDEAILALALSGENARNIINSYGGYVAALAGATSSYDTPVGELAQTIHDNWPIYDEPKPSKKNIEDLIKNLRKEVRENQKLSAILNELSTILKPKGDV